MWTLIVKTSLPQVCRSNDDLKTTASVFDTFADAKYALREVLKELAFSDNAMFDGDGHLIQMDYYTEDRENTEKEYPVDGDDTPEWISSKVLHALRDNLRQIFCGEDTKITLNEGQYNDAFISIRVKDGNISIKGFYDGPINGINPCISIDMFDMTTPKNYHLYIDDFFGGLWEQKVSAELYIDLVETAK